jgi:hypothetical protein
LPNHHLSAYLTFPVVVGMVRVAQPDGMQLDLLRTYGVRTQIRALEASFVRVMPYLLRP